jgi:hypothetical protein
MYLQKEPDPPQNVMDPQHWFQVGFLIGSDSLSVANLDPAYPFPKVPNQMLECRAGKSNLKSEQNTSPTLCTVEQRLFTRLSQGVRSSLGECMKHDTSSNSFVKDFLFCDELQHL